MGFYICSFFGSVPKVRRVRRRLCRSGVRCLSRRDDGRSAAGRCRQVVRQDETPEREQGMVNRCLAPVASDGVVGAPGMLRLSSQESDVGVRNIWHIPLHRLFRRSPSSRSASFVCQVWRSCVTCTTRGRVSASVPQVDQPGRMASRSNATYASGWQCKGS